jgi:hypothetical protein
MDGVADHIGGALLAFWSSWHSDSLTMGGVLRKGGAACSLLN